MNDTQSVTHRRTVVDELVEDTLALENFELRERVADLEADTRSLRELLSLALEQLRDANERSKLLTQRVRTLTDTARDIETRAA